MGQFCWRSFLTRRDVPPNDWRFGGRKNRVMLQATVVKIHILEKIHSQPLMTWFRVGFKKESRSVGTVVCVQRVPGSLMVMISKTNTNQIQTYKIYDLPVDLSDSASNCTSQHLVHHATLLLQIVDRIRKQNGLKSDLLCHVPGPDSSGFWI